MKDQSDKMKETTEEVDNLYEIEQQDKTYRILRLYELLSERKTISREQLREKYHVSKRSVERDVAFLNDYLGETYGLTDAIQYDEKQNTYILTERKWSFQSSKQIMAIAKIVLGSRAFTREEMSELLENLAACVPLEERRMVEKAIDEELVDYQPISAAKPILDQIWELAQLIDRREVIRFDYIRQDEKSVQRKAEPLALQFSESYFYLHANYIPKRGNKPTILRLDRIENIERTGENANASIHSGIEAEMRKAQFMYGGREMTIRFKFWGDSWQAVLDRLPNSRVIKQDENGKRIIEAQVMGDGIKRWLLSQLDKLEVLEPPALRKEMSEIVENLYTIYQV